MGFSSCGARAQQLWLVGSRVQAQQLWLVGSRVQAQQLWCTGLVAPQHVGSSQTRARTHVPCIGRWILNHCATRAAQLKVFYTCTYIYIFLINLFIYSFLAALGLCCCAWDFTSCSEQGYSSLWYTGFPLWWLLFVAAHRLQVRGLQQLQQMGSVVVAHGLQSTGSVVVVHGLSCSAACGIFPDQGSNPRPLHWQVDS